MKTKGKSHGKMIMCLLLLLTFLPLHPRTISAQSTPDTSMCTRENVPLNPKTNKPYTPDERNQEPFAGAPISKEHISTCLREGKPILNHHIVFEEYRDAWKAVTREMEKYDIPLSIRGGVLHATTPYDEKTRRGGIGLWEFGTDASQLKEEERKTSGTTTKDAPIILIRSKISWRDVFIDSVVSTQGATFSEGVQFDRSTFSKGVHFDGSTFRKEASFKEVTFSEGGWFYLSTFSEGVDFVGSTFSKGVHFDGSKFNKGAWFNAATFSETGWFNGSTFSETVSFLNTQFSKEASFFAATFKGDAGFRGVRVKKTLTFAGTTWERRVDLRGMSAKELDWDSDQKPSEVKGIFDLRDATIGRATFKEVRFQDVVDFSRTNFGHYEGAVRVDREVAVRVERSLRFLPYVKGWLSSRDEELLEGELQSFWMTIPHQSPFTHFANNTFEKETDFLHVTFRGSALLISNRFRSTLDLTGTSFTPPHANLCLSFNRISRLVLGPENLGHPPGYSPVDQFRSLFDTPPLHKSRIRQIGYHTKTSASASTKDDPQCVLPTPTPPTPTPPTTTNTTRQVETLDAIYKTIGQAFLEAKDQGGVNEAWYLQTVAKRDQTFSIWNGLSWLFLDLSSRYTVDVWRTLWISVMIMLGFYIPYLWVLRRLVQNNWTVNVVKYDEKKRTFRIRLFENPIHHKDNQGARDIIPWRDAAALSVRSFTKIGLGTSYPNTRSLKILIITEWVLGVYMLILFSIAVKNNLPFIAPFLGVVN